MYVLYIQYYIRTCTHLIQNACNCSLWHISGDPRECMYVYAPSTYVHSVLCTCMSYRMHAAFRLCSISYSFRLYAVCTYVHTVLCTYMHVVQNVCNPALWHISGDSRECDRKSFTQCENILSTITSLNVSIKSYQ